MDETDANNVINIIFQADHGCPYCVASLAKKFIEKYPDYLDIIHSKFKKKYQDEPMYDVTEIWENAI
jgi:hypothetical protein